MIMILLSSGISWSDHFTDWSLGYSAEVKCTLVCQPSCHVLIRATSWENMIILYANNKSADEPAHSRSLISAFVVHCLDIIIPLVSVSEILSLYLTSVAVQAGLSLTWSQTPKTGFLVTRLINLISSYTLIVALPGEIAPCFLAYSHVKMEMPFRKRVVWFFPSCFWYQILETVGLSRRKKRH